MGRAEKLLAAAETAVALANEEGLANDEWSDRFDRANEAINRLDEEGLHSLSQDDFVRFLELVRVSAWDIPSALMAACGHLDEDEYFFMHRYGEEDKGWIAEHRKKYPDHQIRGEADGPDWEPADKHFKEEHGWDLKDTRINWSFDT